MNHQLAGVTTQDMNQYQTMQQNIYWMNCRRHYVTKSYTCGTSHALPKGENDIVCK